MKTDFHTMVLGAGPVGLIAADLLQADAVIGVDPGGSRLLRSIAPTYLWKTDSVDKYLYGLGLSDSHFQVRFAWLLSGGIVEEVPTDSDLTEYYHRSRGDRGGSVPNSVASSGKPGKLDAYLLSVDELVKVLLLRVKVLSRRVVSVSRVSGGFEVTSSDSEGSELIVTCSRLVNTLPATVFDGVIGRDDSKVELAWKTFFETNVPETKAIAEEMLRKRYDYLYVVDPELSFDRVTFKFPQLIYEYNGRWKSREFLGIDKTAYQYPVQIIETEQRARFEFDGSLMHVGRMARLDHSIRLHNVVEELSE